MMLFVQGCPYYSHLDRFTLAPALHDFVTENPVAMSFTNAHRLYVKSLYKRYLTNSLNWCIRRDVWRDRAIEIRQEFEKNRHVRDPRALAQIFAKAEAQLAETLHPDPYIPAMMPGGTKWERNLPPPTGPIFDHEAELEAHIAAEEAADAAELAEAAAAQYQH